MKNYMKKNNKKFSEIKTSQAFCDLSKHCVDMVWIV